MACSLTVKDADQIDHLSDLSDELLLTILSFLPTDDAARTCVLCRRFRHLWEASPSLHFITREIFGSDPLLPFFVDKFIAMADHALLRRNPSHPLLTLHLELYKYQFILPYLKDLCYISSLLTKARSLGLCHLIIGGSFDVLQLLPTIFSIDSLKSLSLPAIRCHTFPSGITLTCLRSLSLTLCGLDLAPRFNQLLSELCSLQDLHLEILAMGETERFSLSSLTVRKLVLLIEKHGEINSLMLFFPSLESFHLDHRRFFYIHVEAPLVKRAVISLGVYATSVSAVTRLLSCISSVEELSLHVKESLVEEYPFSTLLEPGKDMPDFPNLKRLDVSLCFHEHNIGAFIMMLHNCPALESVKLVHKIPKFTGEASGRKKKNWRSKLPCNGNGDCHYAYFRNLHLGERKKEFMKLLGKRCSSKRHKQIARMEDILEGIWCVVGSTHFLFFIIALLCAECIFLLFYNINL